MTAFWGAHLNPLDPEACKMQGTQVAFIRMYVFFGGRSNEVFCPHL